MALVYVFSPEFMTASQYDLIIRHLEEAGAGTPPGRLFHACFGQGTSLRVFDVWESQDAFEAFGKTLMPILADLSVDPGQPDVVELHNTIPGSTGPAKALVQRMGELGVGMGDERVIDEAFAPDYVEHFAPPGQLPGREGFKEMIRQLHAAFSDFELVIEDIVAEDDRVAARWTCTGTQVGEFLGVPASGNRITVTGIEIDRIAGGRIVESWTQADIAGLLAQAGVLTLPRT